MLRSLALITRPEVVFFNELTTGLDPRARRATWELVRRVRAAGATVVLGVLLFGWLLYSVLFEGHALVFVGGFILCALAMFSAGCLIASLAPNARGAQVVSMLVFYPMVFLSGAGMPLEILPASIRRISDFLPLTYVVRLLRGLWFGEAWRDYWVSAVVLAVILGLSTVVAARLFRWE